MTPAKKYDRSEFDEFWADWPDGKNTPELDARMTAIRGAKQPSHYGSWAEMSAPLWPVPAVHS